jgi:hypothetical protein
MTARSASRSALAAGRRAVVTVALAVLLAAAAAVVVTAHAAPGYAAAAARCSGKTGVTVVVDFTKLRGKVKIGCARRRPANGLVALKRAGFTYSFVPRQTGFVCTIDHRPRRCNGAPSTAYWSYWHARQHGKWMYSKLGAGSYHPKPGWVEGWAFGKGKPPRIPPP